jgi:hypothetical protein
MCCILVWWCLIDLSDSFLCFGFLCGPFWCRVRDPAQILLPPGFAHRRHSIFPRVFAASEDFSSCSIFVFVAGSIFSPDLPPRLDSSPAPSIDFSFLPSGELRVLTFLCQLLFPCRVLVHLVTAHFLRLWLLNQTFVVHFDFHFCSLLSSVRRLSFVLLQPNSI